MCRITNIILFLFTMLPLAANGQLPMADAGLDRIETLGTRVILNAQSLANEDQHLEYFWTMVSRPTESSAFLADANTKTHLFLLIKRAVLWPVLE